MVQGSAVSSLRRKYKRDVEKLQDKVASHELQSARSWLRDENRRLEKDLDAYSVKMVQNSISSSPSRQLNNFGSASPKGNPRKRILTALSKNYDQFEALLAEADPLSRGVLPVLTLKRILCEDMQLAAGIKDIVQFIGSFIESENGHVDYEAIVRALTLPSHGKSQNSNLSTEVRKVGITDVRRLLFKHAEEGELSQLLFQKACEELFLNMSLRRDAMKLFKAMDRRNIGKVMAEDLLDALYEEDSVEWESLISELCKCSLFLDKPTVESLSFDEFWETICDDGASLAPKDKVYTLLRNREVLRSNGLVSLDILYDYLRNDAKSETDTRKGEIIAKGKNMPRHLANKLYDILKEKYGLDSRALFRSIDHQQRGTLSQQDLCSFLGVDIDASNMLFDRFDNNEDGLLDFGEFLDLLMYGKLHLTRKSSQQTSKQLSKRSHHSSPKSKRDKMSPQKRRSQHHQKMAEALARTIRKEGWTSSRLRSHLTRFDTSDCGLVSRSQLATAFKAFPSTRDERHALAKSLDIDDKGSVSIDEAVSHILHPGLKSQEKEEKALFEQIHDEDLKRIFLGIDSWKLRRLFFSHDQDGNGYISTAQFCNLLENVRVQATRKEIILISEHLARKLGTPGSVAYADLMKMLVSATDNKEETKYSDKLPARSLPSVDDFANQASELGITLNALLRRCARLEKDTKSSEEEIHGCILFADFYRVLDAAIDLSSKLPCSKKELQEIVASFLMSYKGDSWIAYASALEHLIKDRDEDMLREKVLSKLEAQGFAQRNSILQMFRLLDSKNREVLTRDAFERAMQSMLGKDAESIALAQTLVRRFRVQKKKTKKSSRLNARFDSSRRDTGVDYLELVHWVLSPPKRVEKSDSPSNVSLSHSFDFSKTNASKQAVDAQISSTFGIDEHVRLLKQELAGLDGNFFNQLEDLKNSYALTVKRNKDLEIKLWEQCAETGQPPPMDEELAKQLIDCDMDHISRVTSSSMARRLRESVKLRANVESNGQNDTTLASTTGNLLGDRLCTSVANPNTLVTLSRAFANQKGEEGESVDDGDAYLISSASFRRVLETHLPGLLHSDFDDLARRFDRDGDGQVRYLEFLDVLRPLALKKTKTVSNAGPEASSGSSGLPEESTMQNNRIANKTVASTSRLLRKYRRRKPKKSFKRDLLFHSDSESDACSNSSSSVSDIPDVASDTDSSIDASTPRKSKKPLLWSSSEEDNNSNKDDDYSHESEIEKVRRRTPKDRVKKFQRSRPKALYWSSDSDVDTVSSSEEREFTPSNLDEDRIASAKDKLRIAILANAQEDKTPYVINLRLAFDTYDHNRDGVLDRKELKAMIQQSGAGIDLSKEEQKQLLLAFEKHAESNSEVRYLDFVNIVEMLENDAQKSPKRRAVLEDRLRKDLNEVDLEDSLGHKHANRREFHRLVDQHAVVPLTSSEKDNLMHTLDYDEDGLVSQKEMNEFVNGQPTSPLRQTQRKNAELGLATNRVRKLLLKLADEGNGKHNLKAAFQTFDTMHSGLISSQAFARSLHKVGFHLSAFEEQGILRALDPHKSGSIDFPSFRQFVLTSNRDEQSSFQVQKSRKKVDIVSAEQLEQLRRKLAQLRVGPSLSRHFKRFATTLDDAFTGDEFFNLLKSINFYINRRQLHHIVSRLDADGSGTVTFIELEAFVSGASRSGHTRDGQDALLRMAMRKVRGTTKNLYQAFCDICAETNSPYVDQASFDAVLLSSIPQLHEQELEVLYNHSPKNELGEVRYAEFLLAFLDTGAVERQFHAKNPREGSLFEGMKRYLSRRSGICKTDYRMPRSDAMRVMRQVGLLAPAWQLEAALDLAQTDQGRIEVNLLTLSELLTQASMNATLTNSQCGSRLATTKRDDSIPNGFSGTVTSMVVMLRHAVRKRALDADRGFSKDPSTIHRSLQTAVRANLDIELGSADTEVLQRLLDIGLDNKPWHWDEFCQAILSSEAVNHALEVDADTDPEALHSAKVAAKAIHKHLKEIAGPTENSRRAFRTLDRARKGRVRLQDIVAVCTDLGFAAAHDNPWVAQGILYEMSGRTAANFERAAPPRGLDFGMIQRFIYPISETLQSTLDLVKRAIRDTARQGGGALDSQRVLRVMDVDKSGRVSLRDLRRALEKLCPQLPPKDLKHLAYEVFGSMSEDGEPISRAEIQRLLLS